MDRVGNNQRANNARREKRVDEVHPASAVPWSFRRCSVASLRMEGPVHTRRCRAWGQTRDAFAAAPQARPAPVVNRAISKPKKKTKSEVPCAHRFARDAAEARVAGRAEMMCVTTSPRTRRLDDARDVPSVRTPSRASPRRRPRNAPRAVPSAVSQSGTRTQFGAGRCVEPSPFSATRARMNRTVSQPPSIEAVRVSSRDAAKSGGVLAPRRARALPKRATPLRSSTSAFIQILFWVFREYPRKP